MTIAGDTPVHRGRVGTCSILLATGKLYTFGIMRSLNSRPSLRGRMTSDDMGMWKVRIVSCSEIGVLLLRVPDVHVISGLKQNVLLSGQRLHRMSK